MYAAVLSIIITYVVLGGLGVISSLSKDQVDDIMGYIAVGVSLLLYSSPFFKIKDVLKYKAGIFIPIRMLTVYMIYHPSKHPLGHGATLEDLLKKETEDNNGTQSISIDRTSVQSAAKRSRRAPCTSSSSRRLPMLENNGVRPGLQRDGTSITCWRQDHDGRPHSERA
ncbi:hypothetical protein PR003_g20310 [Phytophthora rubi]|uniref:Uncharacterized protein n=1 Tax=Phytophthora rubi TaxID=129364 RepID=A0A6A4DRT9_9STRA|nr:hypothetical protein PR003_g20310 [Phytophthora rubi]